MERVISSSEGIIQIVALIEGMLARVNPDATTEWNLVAAPMLRGFQQDLQYQQQQMATYAEAMSPDSIEYHTVQANAALAITITKIYLSSNGLPPNPQYTSSSHPHLPATILTPATTPSGPPNATRHISLDLDNSGEPKPLEIATIDNTVMQEDPSPNATTDNDHLGTITDNEPFLQLNIRQEEVEQLYHEAMDEPLKALSTEDNSRDGLQPSDSEPVLSTLGPVDIEVTVMTSMEHDTIAEEIVDNKTVQVDGEVQSTETLGNPITCHGCKAVGHVLESCPVNHGLTYTDCQMYQMKQTNASAKKKPTSPGIDQLSSRFQTLAKETNPPASPTHPTLNVTNNNTVPGPNTTPQKMVRQITPPAQTNTTPRQYNLTKQTLPNNCCLPLASQHGRTPHK